jgi:hypothetical protein
VKAWGSVHGGEEMHEKSLCEERVHLPFLGVTRESRSFVEMLNNNIINRHTCVGCTVGCSVGASVGEDVGLRVGACAMPGEEH